MQSEVSQNQDSKSKGFYEEQVHQVHLIGPLSNPLICPLA